MASTARKLLTDVAESFAGTSNFGLFTPDNGTDGYPVDLEFTLADEKYYYWPKDEAGIPVREYASVGRQYNPTRIAAFGLAHYNRLLVDSTGGSRDHFLRVADWFAASADGRWEYDFDWGSLSAPWISCMAQGEGISVLVRAYRLTADARFIDKARAASAPFSAPVHEGGVRSLIDDIHPFLEEYPSARPTHTLNGFLYALIGILDLTEVDPGFAAVIELDRLIETVTQQWHRWDLGYWSAYDLRVSRGGLRNPATVSYHRLHITQMSHLALRTGLTEFETIADRWTDQYERLTSRARALGNKIRYRLENRAQR